MGFTLTIFVILVVGSLTVFYARNERVTSASAEVGPSAKKSDHWHVAYGIYVCDHFLPVLSDVGEDKEGIHTHGDGIIHTHPFSQAASGNNARLKVFGDQVGIKFGKDSFTTPDGTEYKSGYKCGDKDAKVLLYRWPQALDPNATADVFDKDFAQVRLKDDRSAMTLAVVPEGTDVPRPDSINTLNNLSDVGPQGVGATAGNPLDPTGGSGISIPGQSSPGISTPGISTPGASPLDPSQPTLSTPAVSTPAVSTPDVPVSSAPVAPTPSTP
jgi:hypothetical protein